MKCVDVKSAIFGAGEDEEEEEEEEEGEGGSTADRPMTASRKCLKTWKRSACGSKFQNTASVHRR